MLGAGKGAGPGGGGVLRFWGCWESRGVRGVSWAGVRRFGGGWGPGVQG